MIPGTGEEIEKREVVKGYEYSRGWAEAQTYLVPEHETRNRLNEPPSRPGDQTDLADRRRKPSLSRWLLGR
jgi:hypothetical protein